MTNDEVNVRLRDAMAACLLVIMTARAAVRGKTGISLWDKIMLSLTMLIFRLILMIPDCLFFWWRDKPSLTIVDMDEKQQPLQTYQVREEDLILFCKTEFDMDFQVDEWKELEVNLKKRLQTEEDKRLQLEQWLQQGRASQTPGSTKVATLEYEAPDGFHADILPISRVPDALCASAIVIKANYPNSLIYHSQQEWDEWMNKLNHDQREEYQAKITGFQRKTKCLLTAM